MKTIALIVVALAIAGAHFEQKAFERCIVAGLKKINEAYAKAQREYGRPVVVIAAKRDGRP